MGDTCELNLITFTSPFGEEKSVESLCAVSPDVALEFASALGNAIGLFTKKTEVYVEYKKTRAETKVLFNEFFSSIKVTRHFGQRNDLVSFCL